MMKTAKSILLTLALLASVGMQAQVWDAVSATTNPQSSEQVYEVVEVMPQYPGGQAAMVKYLSEHVKYPAKAKAEGKTGTVMVQFVVNTNGKLTDTKVIRSVSPELDKEALRVVKSMPKWTPGKQKGKPVRVRFTLPIRFSLK